MDARYLEILPGDLRVVVEEAESLARCKIAVVQDTSASPFDNLLLEVHPQAGYRATIAFRGETISPWALVHEVLHIKRTWLDGAAIILPTASRFALEATVLNDLVAHLEIIPAERVYFEAESNAHWAANLDQGIAEVPPPPKNPSPVDSMTRGRNLFSKKLMYDIALSHLDARRLNSLLTPSQTAVGDDLVQAVRRTLGHSAQTLMTIGQAFRYVKEGFRLHNPGLRPPA